jgi:hypothetical protein
METVWSECFCIDAPSSSLVNGSDSFTVQAWVNGGAPGQAIIRSTGTPGAVFPLFCLSLRGMITSLVEN